MAGSTTQYGARFIVDDPHPTAGAQEFARTLPSQPAVRALLAGSRWRMLWARPIEEDDEATGRRYVTQCEALLYDYTRNRAIRAIGHASGQGPCRAEPSDEQPHPSPEEFADAVGLIRQSAAWGPLLAAGDVRTYIPMPPVLEPEPGQMVERTLYVGLLSKARKLHRFVAVNMVTRQVDPQPASPRGARATDMVCGMPEFPCLRQPRYTPGKLTIEWPTQNPVWRFQAVRPSFSSASNGSGIELLDVRYKGTRVFRQAHLPILNVQYDQDACGPFRDWTYDENCFQAVGQNILGADGFRWCTQPPKTITESGTDAGDFKGVAVFEAADGALQLVTELSAGWYRYIMEWRFYLDGTILPRFRFDAVEDSCVCNIHHHHAFWRFDFEIVKPANVVEEKVNGVWIPIRKETTRNRIDGQELLWRVRHTGKNCGYVITPGVDDGIADDFTGPDQYVLRYRKSELDDGNGKGFIYQAKHDLQRYVKNEGVFNQDLVVWYAGHFRHVVSGAAHPFRITDGANVNVGPTLTPFNWPSK